MDGVAWGPSPGLQSHGLIHLCCTAIYAMGAPDQVAKPALMCCCFTKGWCWHAGVRKLNSRQLLTGLLNLGKLTSLNMQNNPPDITDEFLRAVRFLELHHLPATASMCPYLLLLQPIVANFLRCQDKPACVLLLQAGVKVIAVAS